MNRTDVRSFAELLREYRVAAGFTQEMLAERAHMSRAAIAKLERGARQRPYRATVALLADALALSANDRLELERASQRAPRTPVPAQLQAAINLPLHFSSFVGRERDLAKLCEMLATQRLVTLVGAGGVGKTRLAVRAVEEFIANLAGDHFDGFWFVDLSNVNDGQKTMAAIASSIGMERCDTLDALIRYLRSQRFLLLLDNCEHLVDEVTQLAGELLRQCPTAQILATSRQRLGVEGERIYRVPPLSVPPADAAAMLSPSQALEFSAIHLFVERAEAADSDFELTDSTVPSVAEICRRLDGIALAIELAAARTNAFSTTTIATRLDEYFLIFTGGVHASLDRHRTMEAVFDWSYDLLDNRERNAFRRLSIFTGGFTLELAASLWAGQIDANAVLQTLASLVDKSLVHCDTHVEPTRYRLPEPARQYAREKLREHGEYNETARSHALAMLALAEHFDSKVEMVPDRVWDAHLGRERENFRAAIEWALGPAGDVDIAQRLAGSRTATSPELRSGEALKWTSAALKSCGQNTPARVLGKLELMYARTAQMFAKHTEALAAAHRALDLLGADDLPARASAQCVIVCSLQAQGRHDDADTVLRQARETSRSCGAS